jgi:hypothetical protein
MIIFRCVNVRYAIQIDFLLLSTTLNNHVLERKKYCRVVREREVLEEFNKLRGLRFMVCGLQLSYYKQFLHFPAHSGAKRVYA